MHMPSSGYRQIPDICNAGSDRPCGERILHGNHVCVFHLLTEASIPCETRGVTPWKAEYPDVLLTFDLPGQGLLWRPCPLPHLSGNLSPGSRPRWKIRGSSVCSSWVWVVTPETFCPGQKSMPCNERHREQVSIPEPEAHATEMPY